MQAKNLLHTYAIPRDIAKILKTCYFWYFGHAGNAHLN